MSGAAHALDVDWPGRDAALACGAWMTACPDCAMPIVAFAERLEDELRPTGAPVAFHDRGPAVVTCSAGHEHTIDMLVLERGTRYFRFEDQQDRRTKTGGDGPPVAPAAAGR